MKLLRTLILRPLRRDLLRTALTILAVALGVAVVVAIDLAGDAATGCFRSSMQTLTGKTDLEIIANGGIDERYMAALTALPFDAHFAPVMEAQVVLPGIGAVPLYGADLAGAPERRRRLQRPARRDSHSNTVTGTLAGRPLTVPIGQTLDAGGEFLVLDIADAQQALGRYGKLDRIDVTVGPEEDFGAIEQAIRGALPPSICVEKPGRAQRRKPAHAARLPLESARPQLHLAGGRRVPDLQHHLGQRGAAPRRDRHPARHGRRRAPRFSRSSWAKRCCSDSPAPRSASCSGAAGGRHRRTDRRHRERALHHQPPGADRTHRRRSLDRHSHRQRWSPSLSALAPAREAMHVAPTEAMSRGAREHQARLHWRARPGLVRRPAPCSRWPPRRPTPHRRLSRRRLRRRAARHRRRRPGSPRRWSSRSIAPRAASSARRVGRPARRTQPDRLARAHLRRGRAPSPPPSP